MDLISIEQCPMILQCLVNKTDRTAPPNRDILRSFAIVVVVGVAQIRQDLGQLFPRMRGTLSSPQKYIVPYRHTRHQSRRLNATAVLGDLER